MKLKIGTLRKNWRSLLRHQNSIFDNGRNTEVDKSFYSLPQNLKDNLKAKMAQMEKEDRAIFTAPL